MPRRLHLVALAALLGGLGLLAYAAIEGDLRVGLLLVVPFVYGTGPAAALGMLLLFVALFAWMGARDADAMPPEEHDPSRDRPTTPPTTERRHGGVVLVGPIPIVWGSDRRILAWMVAAGAALLVLTLVAWWALRA